MVSEMRFELIEDFNRLFIDQSVSINRLKFLSSSSSPSLEFVDRNLGLY